MKQYPKPPKFLIQTNEDLHLLISHLRDQRIFGFDTETNAKESKFERQLVGISAATPEIAAYIPLRHISAAKQLNPSLVIEQFRPLLEDPTREIVMHNAKFDELTMLIEGLDIQAIVHDTMVIAWLLDETFTKALKPNVLRYLNHRMETYEEVIANAKVKRGQKRDYNFAKVPIESALSYASEDAYYTLKMYVKKMLPRLKAEGLWNAYDRIERPLVRVVRDMEWEGVRIDRTAIDKANEELPKIMADLEEKIYAEAGRVFNIASGQQLGPIIAQKCKIKLPTTEKTGQYQTGEKILKPYKDRFPFISNVLRWKKISKTYGSFIDGMYKFIEKDGKIHCQFLPQGTRTGRFSSKKPNFQQLTMDGVEDIRVRDYIVASEGNILVQADYSQIELRVMAHSAKDEAAIKAFNDGWDFHSAAAHKVFHLADDVEETPRQRFKAKSINFGVPYGRGPNSIAAMFGGAALCHYWRTSQHRACFRDSCEEQSACEDCAKCLIEEWFNQFPGIRKLKEKTIANARKQGYVRTLAGRKRRLLPGIRSTDWKLKGNAERQAFNTIIQGSAADIIKIAMVQMHPKLKKIGAKLVITCHDEILVDSPISEKENVVNILQDTMEYPVDGKNPLSLPLITEPKVVQRWSDAK